MLEPIVADIVGYLAADAPGRAKVILESMQSMTRELEGYQVVAFRKEQRLVLMSRADAMSMAVKASDVFRYHPFQNPSGRRTAADEVSILLEDVTNGNLSRACEELSLAWQTTATYGESARILVAHGIKLWSGRKNSMGEPGCLHLHMPLPPGFASRFPFVGGGGGGGGGGGVV